MTALCAAALLLATTPQGTTQVGLDHLPVAVRNLEQATTTFRNLGFSLKPGRPHENGIMNAHVKFPDGAGIELLTVTKPGDALATHYVDLFTAGDGPGYFSLHARDTPALHASLSAGGYDFRQRATLTALNPPFSYLFFVQDNRSPTDRPEHFAHANGASAMTAVWVAPADGDALARLLVQAGGRRQGRTVLAPGPVDATVVTLGAGEVYILPSKHQLLPGRPVIGASFAVPDVGKVRQVLATSRITPWPEAADDSRVIVPPDAAHGMWLEFRKPGPPVPAGP